MIVVEFSVAVALYLSLIMGILFFYWMFVERPLASGNNSAADRYIWQCSICTYCYIDSRHSAVSVCPRCGSYNKKEDSIPQKEVKG